MSSVGSLKSPEVIKAFFESTYPDEDILALVEYQLKYFYTNDELDSLIGINAHHYCKRVNECLANYPELRSQYEYLEDYFKTKYLGGGSYPNV